MNETKPDERWQTWAVLELMGHVRTGGLVTEEERFGAKLGRVDIPTPEGGFVTQYFGGGSIYRLTICDEATARRVAASNRPAPLHPWEMPCRLPGPPPAETIEEPDEDEGSEKKTFDDQDIPL